MRVEVAGEAETLVEAEGKGSENGEDESDHGRDQHERVHFVRAESYERERESRLV